jgi:Fimbrial assembly protein (PilN)
MREVEFLPDWYPKVRARKRAVMIQTWATLSLVVALGFWMLMAQRNVHAREAELTNLHTDLNQSEVQLQRLQELLDLQKELGKQDSIFAKIGTQLKSTKLITTIEQLMPRDMALISLTMDTEDPAAAPKGGSISSRAQKNAPKVSTDAKLRLRLHGVAPTDVDLGEFLAKLTSVPFFKQVELVRTQEKVENSHVMRDFEVSFVMDLTGMGAH